MTLSNALGHDVLIMISYSSNRSLGIDREYFYCGPPRYSTILNSLKKLFPLLSLIFTHLEIQSCSTYILEKHHVFICFILQIYDNP